MTHAFGLHIDQQITVLARDLTNYRNLVQLDDPIKEVIKLSKFISSNNDSINSPKKLLENDLSLFLFIIFCDIFKFLLLKRNEF